MTPGPVPEMWPKLLLVDDRPENLVALESVLDGLDADLVNAASGREALKRLLSDDFAVILLDVQMPGMDGFETARLVRERERSRTTPIIFLTAISREQEHVAAGYSSGAVDYVTKPYNPDYLRAKVRVFLELYRQRTLVTRQAEVLRRHSMELERVNAELQSEIQDRMKAETALALSNAGLQETTRRLEEMNEQRSRFFANVSHELRTPLTLILGPVEQRLRGGASLDTSPESDRELLRLVEGNARMLLKQVNELLDAAKLDAGGMDLHYAQLDLARLLRLAVSCFEAAARQRGLELSVTAPDSFQAQADPEKVYRIIMNLVANALKFTPAGGRITCSVRQAERSKVPYASIAVIDTGPGVPVGLREKIFDRFQQAIGQRGGTGLGLSIVRELAELHGGSVSVTERKGGGSQFVVDLPMAAPPGTVVVPFERLTAEQTESANLAVDTSRAPAARPAPAHAERGLGDSAKDAPATVLVVEDHPDMSDFIASALSTSYRVVAAFDGREGLEKALEIEPDLILVDMMMPAMSGEELVRALRSNHRMVRVPIVVLTALADQDLRVQMLRAGAQDFLVKPFSPDELHARVDNLVTMKRIRDLLSREVASQEKDVVAVVRELIELREAAGASGAGSQD